MDLIIDTIPLLSPLTGVGKYTYEISKRLLHLQPTFYYGFYSKELRLPTLNTTKNFLDKFSGIKKLIRHTLELIPSKTYDVYFEPNFIPRKNINAHKVVTTIHDLSFYKHKEWHPKETIQYFDKYFLPRIKKTDVIITDSNYIKNELIQTFGFDSDMIKAIHLGIDFDVFKPYPQQSLQITRQKFNLPQDFILFVGSIEPRKNLVNLLKAYNILPPSIKRRFPLLLVGFRGWNNAEVMEIIDKNKDFISYLGYVDITSLAHLYNLATLFVYPSLYEGFGFPPLEAMACHTAVVTSAVASLPEVCQDSAVYVNPLDIEDIKQKILMLLEDKTTREQLSTKAVEHVKQFTWSKTAQKHLEIFTKDGDGS
ncbi:MAG: glycosyltransferase family 4 protein [Epsilonproteobacteria bacterium]|nr:glycosyltransferase family 4 protein [Campylobacterota bacterium]